MSPEFGSTCAIFPVDAETLRYLDLTGRPTETIELVDAYAREQGMFHEPGSPDPVFSETLELDLGDVVPSIAGPKRPQDRVPLAQAKQAFIEAMDEFDPDAAKQMGNGVDEASMESFPASDPPAESHEDERGKPRPAVSGAPVATAPRGSEDAVEVTLEDGTTVELDHGRVVIAAITSCTNTSNPSVMIGAGLLARNALARGLARKPWVKTSLAPGSTVVTDYLDKAGLTEHLNALQFNLVGYGCTTCIGNSGPLPAEISAAVEEKDLAVCAVLSGNRNFEGRINQDVKANYLASPPLVVAYALAGRMDLDLTTEPLGEDSDGEPVYLRDIWPDPAEVKDLVGRSIEAEMFTRNYGEVFKGDENWNAVEVPEGDRYTWPDSTYVRRPSFFEGMPADPPGVEPIAGGAGAGGARRLDHHRSHLACRRDQKGQPGRQVADRAGRRGSRLQLIRIPPRQPRGDDSRNLRQHPPAQPAGGAGGGLHPPLPRRRGDDDLRRGDGLCRRGRSACRPGGQGVRLGLFPRLGGEGDQAARCPRRDS